MSFIRTKNIFFIAIAIFLSACETTPTNTPKTNVSNPETNTSTPETNTSTPETNTTTPETNTTKPINHVSINEVLASNKSTIKDPKFNKYADYIELYNDDNTSLDISSFGLSDKLGGSIWRFPTPTTIEAKGYLLVWADKKNTGLHTNFKLSSQGENVILFDTRQNILDKITFSLQEDDIAITKDSTNKIVSIKPTPNISNHVSTNKIIDDTIQVPTSNLYINEFMTKNIQTVMDEDFYAFSDWVELYNNSNQDINLSNYKISNTTFQEAWRIQTDTTIPSKGYLVIFLDKKDIPNHSDFSLSDAGSSLTLFASNGHPLDKVNYKKQKSDISYGRDITTHHWGYMAPSANTANNHIYPTAKRADKPKFSSSDNNHTIMITSQDNGEIHYTLNGEIPTQTSEKYTTPIPINQTLVLKAISFKTGMPPSKVKTQTYFKNHEGALPVISLSIDYDYLFDDEVGIYVKGTNGTYQRYCGGSTVGEFNYGNPWERPTLIEYYNEDQQKAFSIKGNLAISGACSRTNAKKSFSFELDKKYGKKTITYPLYEGKKDIAITDLRIRTGNSGYMITDMLAASLVEDGNLNIDYQAYKIVKMYINGEYWGIYHIREKKGKGFIQSNYPDVDKKNIDMISAGKIKAGSKHDYDSLNLFVKDNNLSIETNYQSVLNKIDVDNYIDYMCMMIFSGAQDWLNNNTRLWKEKKTNAKWRWVLDDVDGSFISWRQDSDNFQLIKDRSTRLTGALFIALSKNKNFKDRFRQRFDALLDTLFTPEHILQNINKLANKQQPYMEQEKWGAALTRNDQKTIEAFVRQANSDLKGTKEFAENRKSIVKAQLNRY